MCLFSFRVTCLSIVELYCKLINVDVVSHCLFLLKLASKKFASIFAVHILTFNGDICCASYVLYAEV